MSYLFTLPITCLGLSFMAIKGPTVEVSPKVINYRTLKLTSEKNGARIFYLEWRHKIL